MGSFRETQMHLVECVILQTDTPEVILMIAYSYSCRWMSVIMLKYVYSNMQNAVSQVLTPGRLAYLAEFWLRCINPHTVPFVCLCWNGIFLDKAQGYCFVYLNYNRTFPPPPLTYANLCTMSVWSCQNFMLAVLLKMLRECRSLNYDGLKSIIGHI